MEARCKKVIMVGVAGLLALCIIMASCLCTPAMAEQDEMAPVVLDPAVVKDITFTHKAKSDIVAVILDQPVIYSYYALTNPSRAIIDLAQCDPGIYVDTISYQGGGLVKELRFTKEDKGSGQLTRLDFLLVEGTDFIVRSLPDNNRKLLITFMEGKKPVFVNRTSMVKAVQVPSIKSVTKGPVSVAKAPGTFTNAGSRNVSGAVTAKKAPELKKNEVAVPDAPKGGGPFLRKIIVTPEGIDIIIDAQDIFYNSFTLKKPNRLIVDLMGVRMGLGVASLPINAFGIDRVRIGRHEGKSRLVFEGAGDAVLRVKVIKTDIGLRLLPAVSAATVKTP